MKRLALIALMLAAPALAQTEAEGGGTTFTGGAVTTPITFEDGSESAPAVANTGDENTGLWWCAADAVCLSTGGTERWRLTTTSLTLTLPVLYAAGSVTAPAMAWSADADGTGTGWYRSAANAISGTCNGAECFRVDASEIRLRNTVRDLSGDLKLSFSTVSGNSWNNQASGAAAIMFSVENSNAVTSGMLFRLRSGGVNHVEATANELRTVDGVYLTAGDNNAGAPAAGDCDADAERGRLSIDTTNNRLYVCNGASRGWDFIALTDS